MESVTARDVQRRPWRRAAVPRRAAYARARAAGGRAEKEKAQPEVKLHFDLVAESVHTYGGKGKWAGKTDKCYYYACKSPGCKRGLAKPIKVVSTETGQLFAHLEVCQPELCVRLQTVSKYSAVIIDEVTGERYSLYSFDELLPHHARYVETCFRGFDHYYETRAGNGLLEYIQRYDRRANLPHEQTCKQLLRHARASYSREGVTIAFPARTRSHL
jgi:hypothetical protein